MNHISSCQIVVDYLQDPYVVARFQNYFGVYRKERTANPNHGSIPISSDFESGCHETEKTRVRRNGGSMTSKEEHLERNSPAEAVVTNYFWYYLFRFGASLGYELFTFSFFPFLNWNIDGAVFRRLAWVWLICLYVGHVLKEMFRLPRPPQPPVVHLEPSYSQEYAFPSSHAILGSAIPFSMLIFTMHKYQYPLVIGLFLSTSWCILVCCSRLYMGMHNLLDLLGGLVQVAVLLCAIIPMIDNIDHFQLTSPYSPLVVNILYLLLVMMYPTPTHWSPALGDTTMALGACAGISVGSWLNYQLGILGGPALPTPHLIVWPSLNGIGLMLLRATVGVLCIAIFRVVFKKVVYNMVCYILSRDKNDESNRKRTSVEVPYKFITYEIIGVTITFVAPLLFEVLKINRASMSSDL